MVSYLVRNPFWVKQLKTNTYTDKEVAELKANYQKKLKEDILEVIKSVLDGIVYNF